MRRAWTIGIGTVLLAAGAAAAQGTSAQNQAPIATGDTAPADYARPASWICRPGGGAQGAADGTCAGDLDAMAVTADGTRTPDRFVPAADPGIDCFYVYPTSSDDPTLFSDMTTDESERRTVHAQAARLGAKCRLFAPAYHSVTLAGLRARLDGAADEAASGQRTIADINAIPYRDIRAAWTSYLAHDNRGRGVVLIGHSQGAILLKRLLAEEVDGRPAQRLLVGAYLAGNPDLGTGSFRAIRPCTAAGQTGCLIAWSSYGQDYAGERRFGGSREGQPICVNPAAIGGGRAMLKPVLPHPSFAPAGDPPYVEPIGQLSAECVTDGAGAVLRVRVEPGRFADLLQETLARAVHRPTWGLHGMDVALTQGDVVDNVGLQAAAWGRPKR